MVMLIARCLLLIVWGCCAWAIKSALAAMTARLGRK